MMDLAKKMIAESGTVQEARTKLLELQEAGQEHFFGGKELAIEDAAYLLGVNVDNFEEVFKRAQEDLDKVESIVVYTACGLSPASAARVVKKAREAVGTDVFVDFKLDVKLLGGAALAFRGQYRDYSLKARFEEKKAEIREIYLSYLSDLRNL